MRKILTTLAKILTNVFLYVFAIVLVGSAIAMKNVGAINAALKIQETEWQEINNGEEAIDSEYFKSDTHSVKETKENSEKFSQDIVREGSVLVKNENKALPLSKGNKVNLYSVSSVDLVYSGTGSSGTNTSGTVDLKTALERSGLEVNEELWGWYSANKNTYGRGSAGGTVGQSFAVKDANWSEIGTEAKNAEADAAIFVLARNGGEGADLTISGGNTSDMTDGNYLKLSPKEKDVLRNLKSLKGTKFSKIIVLLNSANQVESKFLNEDEYGIDAALWIGDVGSTGIYAVAELLVGDANPSGRLADTFWSEHYLNPVHANFGAYTYGSSIINQAKSNSYVVYQEGIYVGYRYTETRYEDYVLGAGNAGDFDYKNVVTYPFGHGISYSNFTYSNFEVAPPLTGVKDRSYKVSVTVTNDSQSEYSGMEVVQIYLQKPYTDYDKENNIEKAAVELVGFEKTGVLAPGASETVTIDIKEEYLTSYDAYGAGTYILDGGKYYFTAGKDAHDAINNILAVKGKKVADGMTADGKTGLVKSIDLSFDKETYSVSSATGAKIENRFSNADLNLYEGSETKVDYITRSNWEGTVKLGYSENNTNLNNNVVVKGTSKMSDDVKVPTIATDNKEYPTYGSTETSWKLIDMRGLAYDAEEWDQLLDQLTWDSQVKLVSDGFRRTVGLAYKDRDGNIIDGFDKPATIDHNGATGPTQPYGDGANGLANTVIQYDDNGNPKLDDKGEVIKGDPDKNQKPTVFPCNGLVASTFNKKLAEDFGVAMGHDCLWAGYSGLYGYGINTHRSTYGGRTFEYYSEDSVLAGQICAAETRGIQSKGCNVYLKHCFLNDQERNREGICTWANEQSIREIYLKSFQIAIEDGNALNVMTGFNRLGVVWTGHHGFINTVLHGEFGMKGCAVSDWFQGSYMTTTVGVLNGNDIPDSSESVSNFAPYKYDPNRSENYGELAWALRESAHRILYHTANSNAMNGITPNMIQVALPIWWIDTLTSLKVVTGVLFGLSAAFLVAMICWNVIKPEKSTATAENTENDEEL